MANYKTPGVYIEEIATLGSSVASVPTAIPGFVGYTEKADAPNGSAYSTPVRITSMLEFEQIYGGPKKETFAVTLTGTVPAPSTIAISSTLSTNIFYYQMQMFFANGGGACYVVCVGLYQTLLTEGALSGGVTALEGVDEVTLLVVPEAVFLGAGPRKTLYDQMIAQCSLLQDRFAILDVLHTTSQTVTQDADDFRNSGVGANNLKYAAAYYPALKTTLAYAYDDTRVIITDSRTQGSAPFNYNYTAPNNTLHSIQNGIPASATITIEHTPILTTDAVTINGTTLTGVTNFASDPDIANIATNLMNAINANTTLSGIVTASIGATSDVVLLQAKTAGAGPNAYTLTHAGTNIGVSGSTFAGGKDSSADTALYNQVKAELGKYLISLYPSAAMAGVYARVDADRGVWKAPANVGITMISEPSVLMSNTEQEGLNVDATSGKSINAIRNFSGRGNVVWGARTLAGNDNEWRYINVRRLFIYVEESIKKATEFVVFEPNTAATWQRMKAMSEAFLTSLWRDGALAGAVAKDAFFVRVGLGETMTPQDILEGRMIVEIGLAASRPAEFIILKFSHKLQES